MKKLGITFCIAICLLVSFPSAQATKADAGLTLGIIGTALGGAALGLGAINSIGLLRHANRPGHVNSGAMYYGAPVGYSYPVYSAPAQVYYAPPASYSYGSYGYGGGYATPANNQCMTCCCY